MRPQYVGIVCQRTDVKKVVEVRHKTNLGCHTFKKWWVSEDGNIAGTYVSL